MVKQGIVIIADYSQETEFTLDELLNNLNLNTAFVENLIEFEIVRPHGRQPNEWIFDADDIKRIQRAKRLQRDLEINFPGIALILEMMDEMEELRTRANLMERHLLK